MKGSSLLSMVSSSNRLLLWWLLVVPLVASLQLRQEERFDSHHTDGENGAGVVLSRKMQRAATTTSPPWSNSNTSCFSAPRTYDPILHKPKYRVAIHAIRDFESALRDYNTTFSQYLTATAGHRFSTPIEFELVAMGFEEIFQAIDAGEIDFIFANPGTYSCVGVERGAQPLATKISRLFARNRVYDLDGFGGVIFTRADNEDINTLQDLEDKVVAAGHISVLMGGQAEIYEMEKAGLSHVMSPKQMVFTGDQFKVVQGVYDGTYDVGFVRTYMIEQTKDAQTGELIDTDLFKVLEPKFHDLPNGDLFPFMHTTEIYPEWPVAALPHVHWQVSKEVADALVALQDHADTGDRWSAEGTWAPTRCDTTKEWAQLAQQSQAAGKLAGFRTPRSYFEVRTLHQTAGFMQQDQNGDWQCSHANILYDAISCPVDYYKLPLNEYEQACDKVGLTCPEDSKCFCKPCLRAFEVDVFQRTPDMTELEILHPKGCHKMEVCGIFQQTKNITLNLFDEKQRADPRVEVKMHFHQDWEMLDVTRLSSYRYEVHWTSRASGVGIMEIFFDGKQIPQSPVRILVEDRVCDEDFPGEKKENTFDGSCACQNGTIDIHGRCVESIIIAVAVSGAAVILVSVLGFWYLQYKTKKADQMWHVDISDLRFDDPVEVIGEGSFGVVLACEYRGTKIALKKATRNKKGKSTDGTRTGSRKGLHEVSSDADSATQSRHVTLQLPGKDSSGQDDCEVISCDTSSNDNEFAEVDMEFGSSIQKEDGNRSADLSFGFMMGSSSKNKTFWSRLLNRSDDRTDRFHEVILGSGAASRSTRSRVPFLGWFNKSTRARNDFIVEMRVLSRLRHPCITTVMGAVMSHHHDPMLVMERMEYGSLYDLLRNNTMYLSGEMIMQILRDVTQGLRFLHTSRPPILHGDLKGRNILIDTHFRAKLCDFGLSSKKKQISGTPFFLAPEYLKGKQPYSPQCDMYSLGIVMYEIYSRQDPYKGENLREVLRKVCDRRVNKRPPVPESCPPKIADLMKKCWSPDPILRPQSRELDGILSDLRMQDAEPITPENKSVRTTSDMLHDIFPKHIAEALKAGQKVEPEQHDEVTVIFSDIVRFTDISRNSTPLKVSQMLDRLYHAFDRVAQKHGVFKVETIGDAYMGVTNLEKHQAETHAKLAALFAMDLVEEASKILIDEDAPHKGYINVRVGFHSGPVVSNVIGSLNPRYGLFGDTVNTSSRMESNSKANCILCSETSYKLLVKQAPDVPVKKRGRIAVKGKGDMTVYWVGGNKHSMTTGPQSKTMDELAMEIMGEDASDTPSVQGYGFGNDSEWRRGLQEGLKNIIDSDLKMEQAPVTTTGGHFYTVRPGKA